MLPSDMDLYAFGSAIHDRPRARDLDVLLLYRDGDLDRAHDVAEQIRSTTPDGFVDVLAMSRSEEREAAFVAGEQAQPMMRRHVGLVATH